MSIPPVLPARFRAPAAVGMRRERLAGPLRLVSSYRVGLVVAPAGAGKTTLLAAVAQEAGCAVAWLTLDERIGELGPFLNHLRAAVMAATAPSRPDLPADESRTGRGADPAGDRQPDDGRSDGWSGIEHAIAELERLMTGDLLIVLDDLHTIQGQPVESAVQALLDYPPSRARILIAARWRPSLDLHRLRLAGLIHEIGAEELRFRTWEIEELFRDRHGVRLRPEEVATLARETTGWAAGLQLFYLATRGRPASERTKILSGLGGTRLVRDYLTTQVLNGVHATDRDFLIRTSVFDRLTEERCDKLLGLTGSGAKLAELEQRGLFTFVDDDGDSYRYHDVLRVHLLERLVAEHGEPHARSAHQAAARLCERDGALTEALQCYSRAGDWHEVRRLLSQEGWQLADDPADWFELLPASIRDSDPWVLLAMARGLVANGSMTAAAGVYRDAAAMFGLEAPAWVSQELAALDDWLQPALRSGTSWTRMLRAVLDDPTPHLEGPVQTPQDLFVRGVAALVGGEIALADRRFAQVTTAGDTSLTVEAMAAVGRAACAVLSRPGRVAAGDGTGIASSSDLATDGILDDAVAAAELLGYPAVLRVAAAIRAMQPPTGERHIVYLIDAASAADDQWGVSIIILFGALTALALPDTAINPVDEVPTTALPPGESPNATARSAGTRTGPRPGVLGATFNQLGTADRAEWGRFGLEQLAGALDQTASTFDRLAAPALATWARAAALLAWRRSGTPLAPADADRITRAAARLGPAVHALALVGAGLPADQGHPDADVAGASRVGAEPGSGGPGPAGPAVSRRGAYDVARLIGAHAGVGRWVEGIIRAAAGHGRPAAAGAARPLGPATPASPTTPTGPVPGAGLAVSSAVTGVAPIAATAVGATAVARGTPHPGGTAGPAVPPALVGAAQPVRRLTVRCLGGFEVCLDGQPVDLTAAAPRNLELLQVLAVYADQQVHRDRLTALIWPEPEPAKANHSLQVAVSALRKLLDRQPRRAGQGYQLALTDPDDHDVRRLERLLDAADLARRGGDAPAECERLVAAVDLYAGDLIPAGRPTDWLLAERDRLRAAVSAACERAARILTDTGDPSKAIRLAERGLELDRYRDGLWHLLIGAFQQSRQPAAANRAGERYREVLAELGVGAGHAIPAPAPAGARREPGATSVSS